jgi:hypothetical protein
LLRQRTAAQKTERAARVKFDVAHFYCDSLNR